MADDIDIEEHDVLESLRQRQQAPVAAVIKTEIPDEEYMEHDVEAENYDFYQTDLQQEWDWPSTPASSRLGFESPLVGTSSHNEPESEFQFGKIILGSKPMQRELEPEDCNFNMSLVLKDWGPLLENSKCYCQECQILFATVNALDAHKMLAHSFLIAVEKEPSPERNKAYKSTAKPTEVVGNTCAVCKMFLKGGKGNLLRHMRNIHQMEPFNKEKQKDWRLCNHCNIYFPNDTALVKHLYELLPLNMNKTPSKVQTTPTQTQVKSANLDVSDSKSVVNNYTENANAVKKIRDLGNVTITPVKNIKSSKSPIKSNDEILTPSQSTEKQCEICGVEYSYKYYKIHMLKFHSDFYYKRLAQLQNLKLASGNVKYKCTVCNLVEPNRHRARHHRERFHPTIKRKRIMMTIITKSSNKIQKTKLESKFTKPNTDADKEAKGKLTNKGDGKVVVSKSILFKCDSCPVHFLTCTGASAHSRVCKSTNTRTSWNCPICRRMFKAVEKKAHSYQHKHLGQNKFKVYEVYSDLTIRVLCECPSCFVCFDETKFWRHSNMGCDKNVESFFCQECKIHVCASSQNTHNMKHTQGAFTKNDFIKIEFHPDINSIRKGIKRKLEDSPVNKEEDNSILKKALQAKPDKRGKTIEDHFNLQHCNNCKLYMVQRTKYHLSGFCKTGRNKFRCKSCPLRFTQKTGVGHTKLHNKYPGLTLNNFTFRRATDDKIIKPPFPEYRYCKKCNIYFETKAHHNCKKITGFPCKACKKSFEKNAFKNHMQFHNYSYKAPSGQRQEAVLPELIMKYESLKTIWNILYLCGICDTFTDSYDKVIDHCQNHFTNMESYGVVIMRCQICNMKFDSECYRRHLQLHAGSKDLSRKSFNILTYDFNLLFSDEWIKLFNLPEEQREQILSRSIYRHERGVKMKLLQEGPPEFTLYKCSTCRKFVAPDGITHHTGLEKCVRCNAHECSVCKIQFSKVYARDEHEAVHKEADLDAASFRIVAFNFATDRETNLQLLSNAPQGCNRKSVKLNNSVTEQPKVQNAKKLKNERKYKFYKCAQCTLCLLKKSIADIHICAPNRPKKQCHLCGMCTYPRQMIDHLNLTHKRLPDLVKEKVHFVMFNEKESPSRESKSTLYKCNCGLHFTSMKSIEKHYAARDCQTASWEDCSQCGWKFDPLELVNHLCKHHLQNKRVKINVVTPPRSKSQPLTYLQCQLCTVVFYSQEDVAAHSDTCQGDNTGVKCNKCDLYFDKNTIVTHRTEHKENNIDKKDYAIVAYARKIENRVVNKKKGLTCDTLYKCSICDLHFFSEKGLQQHHTDFLHKLVRPVGECGYCGLKFSMYTLKRHLDLHHGTINYSADDFIISEPDLKPLPKNANKIVFYANRNKTNIIKNVTHDNFAAASKDKTYIKEDLSPITQHKTESDSKFSIFKCKKCALHFTDYNTLANHNEDRCSKELSETCDVCDMKFVSKNIEEHKNVHHDKEGNVSYDISYIEDGEKRKAESPVHKKELVKPDKILYKCLKCDLHFIKFASIDDHYKTRCSPTSARVECSLCNIWFTKFSAIKHNNLHHTRYKYQISDFEIICLSKMKKICGKRKHDYNGDNESRSTVKVEAVGDVSVDSNCTNHMESSKIKETGSIDNIESSEIERTDSETTVDMKMDVTNSTINGDLSGVEDSVGLVSESDSPNKSDQTKPGPSSKKDIKLYKCADCNIYFLTQSSCYKHTVKHKPFDSKDYIACKLCGFQFTIMALTGHIKRHHDKPFNLEQILVEEYKPNVTENKVPKIEIYYAIDKDQSRLVSTTSDDSLLKLETGINDNVNSSTTDGKNTPEIAKDDEPIEKVNEVNSNL